MRSPEAERIATALRALPTPADFASIADRRAGAEASVAGLVQPPGLRSDPVDAGGVPAEWDDLGPPATSRVVLFFHGGAYMVCSPATHRFRAARIAHAADGRALVVDYRLAPEHPFPAAVDDALSAYQWLLSTGTPPERIAFGGDSAGGGLALATLLAARAAGCPLPAATVVMSPLVDFALSGESHRSRRPYDPFAHVDDFEETRRIYLGTVDPRHPLASPIYGDLGGLPPLLIQVGADEVLLDDARQLAARAQAAGTDVTLEVWPDMFHTWHGYHDQMPEADAAIVRIGEWLRAHVAA